MKTAMISQPMAENPTEVIKQKKHEALEKLLDKGYFVFNTLFDDMLEQENKMCRDGVKNIPLKFLAKSIDVMSGCDAVYFCNGWEKARGCRIEHEVAKAYGLEIIYEE